MIYYSESPVACQEDMVNFRKNFHTIFVLGADKMDRGL